MIFIARLRNYVTGNIYPAEFNALSFDTAWDIARQVFSEHKVITIYPKDQLARLEWALNGEKNPEPCQKCQQLEDQVERLNREILGLQVSLDVVSRDRSMLLRQLNREMQHEG